jgi:hypothetical protein
MIGRGEHKKKVTYIRRHGLVDRSPPNVLFRRGLLDNSLVQGRAASLGSRVGSQGATGCDGSAGLVNESIFVQRGDGGVGNNGNAVVVDVGSLVELFLKVGVFAVRRNTTGVEGSLVNVAVDHCMVVSRRRPCKRRQSQVRDQGTAGTDILLRKSVPRALIWDEGPLRVGSK